MLTAKDIARALKLKPDVPGQRRLHFDKDGLVHKTIPSKNLAESAANHAREKNLSVAESLCITKKLKDLGLVTAKTPVREHRAIVQTFSGKGGYEGCHTMPCQLVFDNQFPHALRFDSKLLNLTYLQRILMLSARCTWQPKIINEIDSALEWRNAEDRKQHGLVVDFIVSVKAVLDGEDPADAYRYYAQQRVELLREILERAHDEPFTVYDATMMMSNMEGGGAAPADLARLQADKYTISTFQNEYDLYLERFFRGT